MGVESDSQKLDMVILNRLSPQFKSIITTLDALGENSELFTLDVVKGRLLKEEQRRKMPERN